MERAEDNKKFVRLANKRTNAALKYIRLIGNLSNRSNYDFTTQQVKKIFTTLHEEIEETQRFFERKPKNNFNLEEK